MTDNGNRNQWQYQGAPVSRQPVTTTPAPQHAAPSTATKIDALYSWLSYDLQRVKREIVNEMKYSSMQTSSLYQSMQKDAADTLAAGEKTAKAVVQEVKYSYLQNQTIYNKISTLLSDEVIAKLDTIDGKVALLESIEKALDELNEKLAPVDTEAVAEAVKDKLIASLPQQEEVDYEKIAETVAEKTESTVAAHSQQVLDAIAAIPTAENIDYARIVDEIVEKVSDTMPKAEAVVETASAEIDYDRIIYGAAEKVVESLPFAEKVDYNRIEEGISATIEAAVAKALAGLDMDALASAVAEKIVIPVPEVDYETLAEMVTAKMLAVEDESTYDVVIDQDGVKEIADGVSQALGLDDLADRVAEKVPAPAQPEAIDYDKIVDMVSEKIAQQTETIDYDKVCQAAAAAQIIPDPINYDRIAEIVEDKLGQDDVPVTYTVEIDEEGYQAIAEGVSEALNLDAIAEKVCERCAQEEPVVEEVVEEPVQEEVVVEVVEEPVQEEIVVEETVEEPVQEELAVSSAPVYKEVDGQLVDAETGLVVRLKRSFSAKMSQSTDDVKAYYSKVKNELVSYKRINSNVSWHGDRFNFGRDTIAKANICGKTLFFYLALDPNDPEFKTTVYHQKDVGDQKAYESTPFKIKVMSETAAKKALRLIGYLAQKLGTEKENNFVEVDYTEEYAYKSTQELLNEGLIKETKEKKVELDFKKDGE